MEKELGRVGLNRFGGNISEEFLTALTGKRGIKVYREMADNDSTVGAILFAIKMMCRQVTWRVESGSSKRKDIICAEFVESCLHDMSATWQDTISSILSFLTFGFSVHEIVYKRRAGFSRDVRLHSKYNDGLIGWQKLPIRAQDSLWEWKFDGRDNLMAFVQMPPPDFKLIEIPAEKFLLFRTETYKDNPQGKSILRNAYRSWYFKKKIEELEGIGIERDLAGLPVLIAPEGLDIWSSANANILATCNEFVQNIRRDAMEGVVLPFGWELKLLSAGTGSGRQFDTNKIIERYNRAIAQTVLADFIFLGHEAVGSFALSSDKTHLFSVAIGTYLDIICEVFNNRAIPALLNLNKTLSNCAMPRLKHGDIETQDLKVLGEYLETLVGLNLIEPDDGLENYLREQASLPKKL